jgi:Galactose oxidase, central domain
MANGKVLIAGGFAILNGWPAWANAELYEPSSGTFASTGNMTTARYFHTATLLPDGKILLAGGNSSVADGAFSGPLATAELYDPVTSSFTATGKMITARSAHTATLLNNGKVLIAGGRTSRDLTSAELYDPSTGTFTATDDMTEARWWHTATLLTNGKVFIAGGIRDGGYTTELYDPEKVRSAGRPGAPIRACIPRAQAY